MDRNFFHITKENIVSYFEDGPDYQKAYLEQILSAKSTIHLQTYIFEMDSFGKKVSAELINAANRGVAIYLLVDSVGSRPLSVETMLKWKVAGIHFCKFNSIHIKWLYRWGRRLHHKVLLIDEERAFIGGINVNSVVDPISGHHALDFAVLVSGPALTRLTLYLQIVFNKGNIASHKIDFPPISPPQYFKEGIKIKLLVNDWVYRRWQITKHYSQITRDAQKEITIINSYFFPRRTFMRQLTAAAKRGVKVRLILPKFSDWPSYILASEFLYAYFLRNGVEIYQWKKSILHGKIATIDDHWVTIGSFNLNYTSYQQNLEMNVNLYSDPFTGELKDKIEQLIQSGCEKIDAKDFLEHCPWNVKCKRLFYYIIVALVANLSIGMIYQEDDRKGKRVYDLLRIIGAIFFFIVGLVGGILPIIPGLPFFVISFMLVYKQILLNRKKGPL